MPLPNTQSVDVRLPLPQAFTVSMCDMWVLSINEINEYLHEAGLGNIAQPEPAPEWGAATAGPAHGWDAWGNAPQHAPNFPPLAPQYAPQVHFGQPHDYVPRIEFQQLQQQVGGIRMDLREANNNINLLSGNMQSLFSFWQPLPGAGGPSSSSPSLQWPHFGQGGNDDEDMD
jgi:hypothetical protein